MGLDDWSGNEVAAVNGSRIITWYLGEGCVPGGPPRHNASTVLLKTTEQAPPGRNRLPTPGYNPDANQGQWGPSVQGTVQAGRQLTQESRGVIRAGGLL